MNIQEFVINMDLYTKVQFIKEYEQFLDNHYKENGVIKIYLRFAENLMIFSRQDECEHLIRAKFNGLVK